MTVYYEKNTPRKMCEAIDDIGDGEGMKLSRRPWNRFKATHSSWWLVPSAKQPHHQFGKYFFDWGDKDLETIVGGFYVEKGLDEALRVVYPSKKGAKLMMKSDWAWMNFISEVRSGDFVSRIKELAANLDQNIEFHIDGGYVDDPNLYDPLTSKLKNDFYILEYDHSSGKVGVKAAQRKGMQLKSLNKATTIEKLATVLSEFGDDQWIWLNVMIALRFTSPRETEVAAGSEVWTGGQVWERFLSSFADLVK